MMENMKLHQRYFVAGGRTQVVEHLPTMLEALGSISRITK
jgi:hypothetical protein